MTSMSQLEGIARYQHMIVVPRADSGYNVMRPYLNLGSGQGTSEFVHVHQTKRQPISRTTKWKGYLID